MGTLTHHTQLLEDDLPEVESDKTCRHKAIGLDLCKQLAGLALTWTSDGCMQENLVCAHVLLLLDCWQSNMALLLTILTAQ